ncbi:hypothetical protein P691DRAFT_705661 [Macrolepiota fuliginosa MF-IS2]|uniref:Uncharacterized protein n=1 Tax=Macrolepiota fuliginosa MF-IS2 TaxID=1400762 RepID=A0A9P6C3U9_9AGAR|nr:hypothetical protein P691DRAFT_705661 [Macrolepiota fuliginosa MF-IS2]
MGSLMSTSSDTTQPLDMQGHYIPSEADVYAVRNILIEWLPAELADIILNAAEFWPTISGYCLSHFEVQSDASYCCLITPQFPDVPRLVMTRKQRTDQPEFLQDVEANVRRRVKYVTIKLASHDQGWGGESSKWPYAGSWSWFDAEIWRPVTSNESRNDLQLVECSPSSSASIKPMMTSPTEEMLMAAGYRRINPPATADTQSNHAWLAQRNLRARADIQNHTIVWSNEGIAHHKSQPEETDITYPSLSMLKEGPTKLPKDASLPDMYGCGNGAGFVNSLQPGDRIAIIARAQYPGWSNRMHGEMSVEITYSVI